MRLIWLIVIFFISYGSLFPFNFDFQRQIPDNFLSWLLNWEQRTIRSDLIANILLFIPYGFFGALVVQETSARYRVASIISMVFAGIIFALLLQWMQFYLPSRVPHAADAIINSIGILIGISIAAYTNSQRINRLIPERLRFRLTPALLVLVLWIGWQFFPYIPVFETDQFNKGIAKIYQSTWTWDDWLQAILFWKIFYFTLNRVVVKQYGIGLLLIISMFIVVIKLSMFRSQIGWSELSAIPMALIAYSLLSKRLKALLICAGVLIYLLWHSLLPWEIRVQSEAFQWLPFKGFLQGSTWYNLTHLIEQALILSALVYFGSKLVNGYKFGAMITIMVMILINTVQIFLEGKFFDTTSIVIAIVIGLLMQRLSFLANNLETKVEN